MRGLKFKIWHPDDGMTRPYTLHEIMDGEIQWTSDCIVLQYTGLNDKNGVEIYEGDFLQTADGFGGVIEWVDKDAGFKKFLPLEKFEAVGSIYDTPRFPRFPK